MLQLVGYHGDDDKKKHTTRLDTNTQHSNNTSQCDTTCNTCRCSSTPAPMRNPMSCDFFLVHLSPHHTHDPCQRSPEGTSLVTAPPPWLMPRTRTGCVPSLCLCVVSCCCVSGWGSLRLLVMSVCASKHIVVACHFHNQCEYTTCITQVICETNADACCDSKPLIS